MSAAEQRVTDEEWLAREWAGVTSDVVVLSPSEWAEAHRYLPPSVTALPGYYSFAVAPYLREIVDCLSVESPIREVVLMKGVQIGATVGVLENFFGYSIAHVKTAPMMLLTADAELAKTRLESNITPMLQLSGLDALIKSTDEKNTRKTGKTDKKLEWFGGGYAIPYGAKNANKLRSVSIRFLLRDEIDGYPDVVGKDGDPIKLSADRTAAYEASRKILDISTPLIKGQSKIDARYRRGDQRKYLIRCLKCNAAQELRFRHTNRETGEIGGLTWQTEKGQLVHDSVLYLCRECSHPHTNDDKTKLLAPEHGAEWKATSEACEPYYRSYHLSALYSPVGMQTWAACVSKWLEAWDVEHNRPREMGALQVFYNNVLGEPFELRGEKVKLEAVSAHKRGYLYGQIPNTFALAACGSPVLLLTCAVDVHKDNLAVAVWGWCKDRRCILVNYDRFVGDTERLDNAETWERLRKLIREKVYVADDGKQYRIPITLIDSGYRADDVYQFAAEFEFGVYPVKGRDAPPRSPNLKEFSEFTTPLGTKAYGITVDFYKDRWSAALRRDWDGQGIQPQGHFNAPFDAGEKQLRELTVEVKRERIDPSTKQRVGYEWYRPSGAANELWDTLVYGNAALELVAWDLCIRDLEQTVVNWKLFYELLEERHPFFEEPPNNGVRP